jgi:hypothetical protein
VTGPSVGRVVHYVPDDVPDWGGCRAAVVTEVDSVTAEMVSLAVFTPAGVFFDRRCEHSEPKQTVDGLVRTGRTWHWPERV